MSAYHNTSRSSVQATAGSSQSLSITTAQDTEYTPLLTPRTPRLPSRSRRIRNLARNALKSLEIPPGNGLLTSWAMNEDTRPLPPSRRTYGPWHFIGLWIVTGSFNIGGWTTGSSLISLGLNVQQAMATVIIGHMIVGLICVLSGAPGAKWNIGFPILQRSPWGIHGALVPLIQRVMLSFVWYSTQVYWGGQCVRTLLTAIWPTFGGFNAPLAGGTMTVADLVGFVAFSAMCLPLIWIKPEKYKTPFTVAAITVIPTVFALVSWSIYTTGSAGPLVRDVRVIGIVPAEGSRLAWMLVFGVCTNIGGISAHIFSQSDYTRFARRPRDQLVSQLVFVPLNTIVVAFIGIVCTSCAVELFPEHRGTLLWEPFRFLDAVQMHYRNSLASRAGVATASTAFILAQLGIAVAGNALSNGMDLSGLLPRYFNLRRGAYLTAAVAFLIQPWKLLNGASKFLVIMGAYGVFLGSMTGVIMADYYIIRGRRLKLSSLYEISPRSIYWYTGGVNWRASAAWIMGTWALLPGFVSKIVAPEKELWGWSHLYYMSWPLGFVVAMGAYVGLDYVWPIAHAGEVDEGDYFGRLEIVGGSNDSNTETGKK
ncbi:Uracil permease [Ceratocystis lukuohia]|uniref:Uracil permease n=1 Tax=Ceratocystis lukuohia TaxID=2019550 RepID=A0ABR4MEY0_9PEZI